MAFTAELLDAQKSDTEWKLRIKFVDGADISIREFRFSGTTTQQLINFVRSQVVKTEEIKSSDFTVHIGAVLDLTVPPIAPPTPTAAEIAKAAWFDDWGSLNQMLTAIEVVPALATTQANTAISNLRTSLESNWLNSYLGDL